MRPTNHVLVPLLSQVGLMSDVLLPTVSQARRKAPGGGAGALPFPAGVFFNSSAGVEAAEAVPWLELLSAAQTFSNASLAVEPQSYQVSFEWLDVLRASATKHSATWLHSLHMVWWFSMSCAPYLISSSSTPFYCALLTTPAPLLGCYSY